MRQRFSCGLATLLLGVFSGSALQAAEPVTCEGMDLEERAMLLCDSFFNAYGCGGGLQREEVRCHRLGQEFEHQTGIPWQLLPGLAGTREVFNADGGQLAIGELVEFSLAPGSIGGEALFKARLSPKAGTAPVYHALETSSPPMNRAVLDIRINAGESPPLFRKPPRLVVNLSPFIRSLDEADQRGVFRLAVLRRGDDRIAPVFIGEAVEPGDTESLVVNLALSSTDFVSEETLTGQQYEAVISVVSVPPRKDRE